MSSFLWTTRRGFLIAGAGALVGASGIAATPACTLTSEQEEGPYYIDDEKLRADITEGRPGVPLKLRIALVDSRTCAPLANAAVDIWHCDALGVYSGFTSNSPDGGRGRGPGGPPPDGFDPGGPPPDGPPPEFGRGFGRGPGRGPGRGRGPVDATRFLRGVQITDAKGIVEFSSLYPGWYSGRAIHFHMKTHTSGMGGHVAHTGQMFFPEDLTERIAKREPYATRLGVHRTTQSEDNVFRNQHGAEQMAGIERLGKADADGFIASVTVAVDPEASPRPVGGGGRGPR
jgi:protocatechuate 3,4-dioxygenase beta subunit